MIKIILVILTGVTAPVNMIKIRSISIISNQQLCILCKYHYPFNYLLSIIVSFYNYDSTNICITMVQKLPNYVKNIEIGVTAPIMTGVTAPVITPNCTNQLLITTLSTANGKYLVTWHLQ